MAEPTAIDRVLNVVHDYVPKRAQAWIEDRAFLQRVETVAEVTEKRFGEYISGLVAKLDRETASPEENARAAESWRRDAGESYMAEKANGPEWKGQPDFFDNSIIPVRAEQKPEVPQVSLKDNVDYQQQRACYEKQQRNAEAWAVASPVARDANREQGVTSVVTLRQ